MTIRGERSCIAAAAEETGAGEQVELAMPPSLDQTPGPNYVIGAQ